MRGIFDGEHYFIIQSSGSNQTTFIQGENFTGLFSGVLFHMIGENTEKGFQLMNQALKARVEAGR